MMVGPSNVWFTGSVKDAVEKVKAENRLLIVFIQSNDKLSTKYKNYFDRGIPLDSKRYIAIRIAANSISFEHFKRVYDCVPIPAVFIIEPNGRPSAICCSQDPCDVIKAIRKVSDKLIKATARPSLRRVQPKLPPKARIQFRLPTNEFRAWDFPVESTLRDVRLFLMENLSLGSDFTLLRLYPRTHFTKDDESKTLHDLGLTPNATLIVILGETRLQSTVSTILNKNALLFAFIAPLLRPIASIYGFLRNFFTTSRIVDNQEIKNKQNGSTTKKFYRKDTTNNVYCFAFNEDDSDSDMNTDNGNTTQQQ